ncbi:NADPH--cytochrome P450 reductase-like [Rhopilema esculentum]|uniref:NADPH--cytochrome P450 reductase-like n=1 Tax=Rhopilema esculentum TaxID=499914 RepID=UPI0031D0E377|eukprot:gene1326-15722_t
MNETASNESSGALIGPVDIILLLSFLCGAIYFFFRRKKKEDATSELDLGLKQAAQPTPSASALSSTSSFVTKMKNSGKSIAIFYGSQTGTAEEFSNRLAKDAQRYNLKALVIDPEECDVDDLPSIRDELSKSLVVFVMATYGEGDPTDNAQELYEWLHEEQDLNGLNFAVFGLGNKTYEHYNSVGRYVDKRLAELGGNRVCDRGEGDDDANIEEDFVNWRETFWPKVCQFFDIHISKKKIQRSLSVVAQREFRLNILTDVPEEKIFKGEIARIGTFANQRPPYDAKNPYLAPIKVNRELHQNASDRSCMHIELEIEGSGIRYHAGDHVGIYPVNDQELVNKLGELLDVELDTVFKLVNVDEDATKKSPFPCPTTYRTALLHYVDIANIVKTHILAELVPFACNEDDRDFLSKIVGGDEEGKSLYNEWVVKDHRNIVSILEDLPSVRPPLDLLLELLPRLQCRYYSISSSSKLHPTRIHVTAVVVDWMTRIERRQKGVATTWLKEKTPSESSITKVPIFVRHTTFRLPVKPSTPAIMIGPGTGLAPFRGFIQERYLQKQAGAPLGETVLFFGCRKKAEDYLYKEELESYEADGTLAKLFLAFSRDQAHKIYVTHHLKEQREYIWKLIEKGGHIYVCGDARTMAKDVHSILEETCKECGGMTNEAAASYIKNLSNKNRYSVDVWS